MASIPARQSSRPRRASPPPGQSQAPTSQPRESQSQLRSASEDSQTIFVNKPEEEPVELQEEEPRPAEPPPTHAEDDDKKCWICMGSQDEDTPETSPWRDPCPCALVAHEDCLLDWIADMEAPKNTLHRNRSGRIECPQCKAEIMLSRPRDYIVEAVRGLEDMLDRAVIPVSGLALTSAMVHISQYVGVHTIYAIFGADDGNRLLEPLWRMAVQPPIEVYASEPEKVWRIMSELFLDRLRHWRLIVGLPLITPVLVLSRTSLADSVLPVLPIVFFASQAHSPSEALDFASWPPSASFAFAVLPYVRSLYNAYYRRVWAEKEQAWIEAVKPRVSQQNEQDAAADNGQNPAELEEEEGNVFEVRIEQNFWENDWAGEDERLVQEAADRNHAARQRAEGPAAQHNLDGQGNDEAAAQPQNIVADNAEPQRNLPLEGDFPQADNEAAPAPQIDDGRLRAPRRRQDPAAAPANAPDLPAGMGERRLSLSLTGIAETFLGALFFPTIAGLAGEALKLVLPHTWVTEPPVLLLARRDLASRGRLPWAAGFLQRKWARSLVGGCLFVVFKDFLILYTRWKSAQLHKSRRILDVDRRKGRGSFRP